MIEKKEIKIEAGLIEKVAQIEDVGPEHISRGVNDGTIVVLKNKKHPIVTHFSIDQNVVVVVVVITFKQVFVKPKITNKIVRVKV